MKIWSFYDNVFIVKFDRNTFKIVKTIKNPSGIPTTTTYFIESFDEFRDLTEDEKIQYL
jgi:uncharacterized protein (UPF0333 family)